MMSDGTLKVLGMVAAERERQDGKWGGPQHDDEHSTAEFVQLIQDYAAWARVMAGMGSREKARRRLVQVAALAVAAVESIERRGGLTPEEDDEAQAMNDLAPAA